MSEFKLRVETEARHQAFSEFQDKCEQRSVVPASPKLFLRSYRILLHFTAEILIGLAIGGIAVLSVFLIVNKLLHLNI